jgi:enamidase
MPGLIDVHTHLQTPIEIPEGFRFFYFLRSIITNYSPQRQAYLANGVTTVRDMGGSARKSFQMRERINRRKIPGPRLFSVGWIVTSPQGHPVSTIWPASISREGAILAQDEKTLIEGLNRNLADAPDAVKFIHGTIGRAPEKLSADLLTKGIRWANDHQLMTIVHVETPHEFETAIRAGATGVEHAAYLQEVPQSLRDMVSAARPFVDPTFGEFEIALILDKTAPSAVRTSLERSYESLRQLHRAGARIVIGTDAPMTHYGSGFHNELQHFLRAGFDRREILEFATVGNAAYLGKARELGRIEPGYRADLILTRDNPLEKLETLRHPVWTMVEGQIVASGR